jgi:hypothetical protein
MQHIWKDASLVAQRDKRPCTFSEADILSIFFDVMGGQNWNAVQKKHWKDSRSSICKWEGVQ